MKFIKQEGIRDCGICCLYNIIRFYGGNIDIEKLRDLTKTNENGTSIYNLIEASNKLGFISKAYHCEINDLESQIFPLIAYTKINSFNHFVIVLDIDVDIITIFDPIRGKIIYDIDNFSKEWQNIIITFERKGDIVKDRSDYYNYIYNIITKNKKMIIFLSLISIISSIFGLLFSFYLKKIFDKTLNYSFFNVFLFLCVIKFTIEYFRGILSIKINTKIDYELSSGLYNKIYSLPGKYHFERPAGDISSRINDLYNIKDFISTFTYSTIIDLLLIPISLLL